MKVKLRYSKTKKDIELILKEQESLQSYLINNEHVFWRGAIVLSWLMCLLALFVTPLIVPLGILLIFVWVVLWKRAAVETWKKETKDGN